MIDRSLLKQTLVVLSSACSGFYVGGRYVGGMAITEYMGPKPAWLGEVQATLLTVAALAIFTLALWIVMDYREQ